MATSTLAGITVLDLTSYLAGPYAATLLGDMGANVIKIEAPGGDFMRHYPSTLDGESRAYVGVNRNKRSVVLDLKSAAGLQALYALVEKADVLIQNFRPGVAAKLRIDSSTLRARNSRLVYCALTGFGPNGPMAGHPGFDQVLQALTGVAHAQGADDGRPQVVWGSIIDYFGASLTAMAVAGALYNREKTGEGQDVDVSLLSAALALQAGRMVWAQGEPREVQRDLKGGRLAGIHPTKQGFLYLQAQTPKFWTALCELVGLPELAKDPRYDDMRKRKQHEDELVPRLRDALKQRSALEWEALFGTRVPCAAVRTIEDMFDHPQVVQQGLVATHEHRTLGSYRAMTQPVRIAGGGPGRADRPAPLLGEHTAEVLREQGFTAEAIASLLVPAAPNADE